MTELEILVPDPLPPAGKPLDTKTVEVLALTVFRAIFREGIRVPLTVAGTAEMDLVVRDANVLVNLKKVQVQAPELQIWRLTLAYQGKPVVEYGRGIKNDMRIHLPRLCFLLLALWRERGKKIRFKARANAARDREMMGNPGAGPTTTES